MKYNKYIKIKFPKDNNYEGYDGKIHIIEPISLELIRISNNDFYVLTYEENNLLGTTLLGKTEEGLLIKIPLDNYDYLFNYLNNNYTENVELDLLYNQELIDTTSIQNAEHLFDEYNFQRTAVSPPPPSPPNIILSNSNNPPSNNPFESDIRLQKKPEYKFAYNHNYPTPPDDEDMEEKNEQKNENTKYKTIYIGTYRDYETENTKYATFIGVKRDDEDRFNNIFSFERNPYNETLDRMIKTNIAIHFMTGKSMSDIIIDYGIKGEPYFLIDADLSNYDYMYIDEEEYGKLQGRYNYKMIIGEFKNIEDFKKFNSSKTIKCSTAGNENFDIYTENPESVFLALTDSNVSAEFKDNYLHTDINSYAKKQRTENNKSK